MSDAQKLSGHPADPHLVAWLATLGPDIELALRYAMRGLFRRCRDNAAFERRVAELEAMGDLSRVSRDAIMRDAETLKMQIVTQLSQSGIAPQDVPT